MAWHNGWAPYVPVAVRRRRAMKKMEALRKKGADIQPVEIKGRKISQTFWGQAWCQHLEGFSDFENRLPRGRTYVRNGSVCHLAIAQGQIEAKVSGSSLYTVRVQIKTLPSAKWKALKHRSSGQIGSLLELLQGRLSDHVMEVVTDRQGGLFPLPGEMSFQCSCPDWALMCKHVAAVLYGVGARLDSQPELLFKLRGVNHEELIAADAEQAVAAATTRNTSKRLADTDIGAVFGIDLADDAPAASADGRASGDAEAAPATRTATRTAAKKTAVKKTKAKKTAAPRKTKHAVKRKAAPKKTRVRRADAQP